jgi:two-component system sensor histidine kinase BaeS
MNRLMDLLPKGIFARTFSGLLASSLVALIVMSLMAGYAIKTSIMNWNQEKKEDLEAVLVPMIAKAHRLGNGLGDTALESALLPYMTDSLFVYVFDAQKRPVLLIEEGRRISDMDLRALGKSPQSLIAKHKPLSIKDGTRVIAYLSVDSADFLAYKANRQFVDTMRGAITAGILIAIVLCLAVSVLFSTSFSGQTKALALGIVALSQGERKVVFPRAGTSELVSIARSAEILQGQLEREERLRMQWMQDISHDLRTPIAAIKSQFEAMVDGVLDTSPSRLERLLSELNHVEALVRNLQELSRYESPEMRINASPVAASAFLDDIRERFRFLCDQAGFALECAGEDIVVSMDELLMQRCVSNIVQNALQHSTRGGSVRVAVSSEGPDARITIANTGQIPETDIERMFDRLYRGNSSRPEGGFGLGLSIAKAIMDLHGGRISASNADGMAIFTLDLPARVVS